MVQCIPILEFMQGLLEREEWARKGARIVEGILRARSARMSEIARAMSGAMAARYKEIQRFLDQVDLRPVLLRLFQADAPYVIGDVTEIPRPQARKTAYVGVLKDGKTKGFWLLVLATPFHGRAIPFHFLTFSSKTIAQDATSRNMNHCRAFDCIQPLLGNRPLILDREFSYLELLLNLVAAGVHFVIRLNLGSHPPTLTTRAGRRIDLNVSPGEEVVHTGVLYKGQVHVNVIGGWEHGLREPLWVITDLDPHRAWQLYQQRMKIEESFRDLKSLLGLHKAMSKTRRNLDQLIALVLIAYAVGLVVGETLRDFLTTRTPADRRASQCYSGLFLLLKHKLRLARADTRRLMEDAMRLLLPLVYCPVRTHV